MKYLFVPLRQRREHSHTRLRMVSPAQGQATARDFFISQTALDTCRKMCPPLQRTNKTPFRDTYSGKPARMEESLLGKKNLLSVLLEPCMSSFSRGPIPSENLSFRHSSVRKLLFLSCALLSAGAQCADDRFTHSADLKKWTVDAVRHVYSGSVDGKKFDGGTAEKQTLLLGSHTFIPGFEEQVEGMSVGEEKDINVKFPDDYHAENLKGKDSVFHIKLHGIRFKELPVIDDEFAKDVSEFDTLADYRKDIEKHISERKNAAADTDVENRLLQMIVDKCKVEIPQCMIETQIDNYIREFQYSLTYQGLKIEDYLKYTNTTMEALRDNYREKSAQAVKTRLVMEAIVKAEKIKCDAKSLNQKIKDFAADIKRDFKEYKESLNERQLGYFENEVITDKLLEMLKKENTIEA